MPSAVERELEACLPRLYGYAVSLSGDAERARDLVQDCAVKALAATSVPTDRRAIRAWLFRILRNRFIDSYRRGLRRPVAGLEPESEGQGEYPRVEERLIHEIAVRQALDRQSEAHREILALVDLAGFSYADAASILDVPAGTVMSRVARARKALLATLGDSNIRQLRTGRKNET